MAVVDNKPYVEHDPFVGYRYVAGTRRSLERPGGGRYEIAINAAGIRSNREYSPTIPPGTRRALVLGDSYTAGQFVSNDHRFTEIIERRNERLELMNLALEGTGTDQQLLIYEQQAEQFEHDLVLVFPFLQNIRRNLVDARAAFDPKTGAKVWRPKPRFELIDGRLELRNSPVPTDVAASEQQPSESMEVDESSGAVHRVKSSISQSRLGKALKSLVYAVKPWEPFPEYKSPDGYAWRLMEALLKRFHERAAPRPLVIVPLFYDSYVRYRMARNYWERFRSLEGPGVCVLDLLPHFHRLGRGAVKCFQVPHDCHFSSYGHLVVADALEAELRSRGLIE